MQVANHYGQTVDKRSFAGRIAFAREHVAQITASAANPLGHGIYDRSAHLLCQAQAPQLLRADFLGQDMYIRSALFPRTAHCC